MSIQHETSSGPDSSSIYHQQNQTTVVVYIYIYISLVLWGVFSNKGRCVGQGGGMKKLSQKK